MISWFQANVEHLLAASNFTIAFFMFIMGTIVARYTFHTEFSKKTDIKIMLIGLTTLCYGLSIHRLFWGSNRIAKIFPAGHVNYMREQNMISILNGKIKVDESGVQGEGPSAERIEKIYNQFVLDLKEGKKL